MKLLGEFVLSCKCKDSLLALLQYKIHLIETSELYSLSDIQDAIQGKLTNLLSNAIKEYEKHIKECEVIFFLLIVSELQR